MLNLFHYLHVLAIDEFPSSLRLLQANLTLAGFSNVDKAEGALMATQLLSRRSYHIAFVDLEMREIDGLEFLDYLRRDSKLTPTLRVAVSDDGSARRRSSAVEAGADAFLSRPLSPERLSNSLLNLLSSPAGRRSRIVALNWKQDQRPRSMGALGFDSTIWR